MRIEIDFTGWADGLEGKRKESFPVQTAFYKATGDCDWEFEIKTKSINNSHLVYNAWEIEIEAKRICSQRFIGGNLIETNYNKKSLKFIIPQYTKAEFYLGTLKALKGE